MMRRSVRLVFSLLFPVAVCEPGLGQQADVNAASPGDTLQAVAAPVIVRSEAYRLPFAVSRIPDAEIRQVREPGVEPLLNMLPGVWMQTGALNTNRISIRGVGYREPFATSGIKVYLDEIPLTNGAGEASIEDIHPALFSGIQVWRGPGSAIWGAGLGGMIHLRSARPSANTWQTRLAAGSFGRFQADQHVDLIRQGKHESGVSLHYQFLHDDGFRENNDYRRHSLTAMPVWSNRKGFSVQALLHWIDLRAFIPSSLTLEDYTNDPQMAAPTWQAVEGREDYTKMIGGLHWQYAPGSRWSYSGALFATGFNAEEVRPFNVLHESSRVLGTRHRLAWAVTADITLQSGIEFFAEQYRNETYETLEGGAAGDALDASAEDRSYGQFFLQGEVSAGSRWVFLGGLNAAVSTIRSSGMTGRVPLDLFPMGGVSYRIGKEMVVTAQVSRGYSALSADDVRNADGSFDPGIVPETGWSRELSVRVGAPSGTHLVVGAYVMDIDNTVLTRRLMDDIFVKLNGGSSRHAGPEVEYQVGGAASLFRWQGAYTYAAHTFVEFADAAGDFSGNRLPGMPRHTAFNRVTIRPGKWPGLYFEHRWISELYLDDANSVTADGYSVFHAGLRRDFPLAGKWTMQWSLDVHNVFNTRYASMFQLNAPGDNPRYYYPAKPRAVYVAVAFSPAAGG